MIIYTGTTLRISTLVSQVSQHFIKLYTLVLIVSLCAVETKEAKRVI